MEWALLAPGPSARELVPQIPTDVKLGVIGNAFELVDSAEFLVSADRGWWLKHPAAIEFKAAHYCNAPGVPDVVNVSVDPGMNSGLIGLIVAVRKGATQIRLYGFDMHGSHFFGQYENGLRNTTGIRREAFHEQYAEWAGANRHIEILNCTPGSALTCFPFEVRKDG
jgi:hypothetical protein